ncbi:MAG: hypothetical protein GY820_43275 [Gammaproteobacteria bacterium]|nr:hypothetical protein [Gammaproteobacteria bacterium]
MDMSTKDRFRKIEADIEELKKDMKKEQEQEPEQEQMLKCMGGGWYLDAFAEGLYCGNSTDDYRSIGTEHETEAEAIKAGKRRVQQEIINNHATRLNKEDGFVANWEEVDQHKYFIVFNHSMEAWRTSYTLTTQTKSNMVMSRQSATYLQEKLNKGLITGVNANGDI